MNDIEKTKADYLILLVGTSAMPNLIAISTRIKHKGKVFLIHTNGTADIADNIKRYIEDKNDNCRHEAIEIESESVEIFNYDIPHETYNEVSAKFREIRRQIVDNGFSNYIIELGYTGGTKVMSNIACLVFKEVFNNSNLTTHLTYLDGEENLIYILNPANNTESVIRYSKGNETLPLSIQDVINVHLRDGYVGKMNQQYKCTKFSKSLFEYILNNISKKDEITERLNYIYKNIKKIENSKNKVISKLDEMFFNKNFLEIYNDKQQLMDDLDVDIKKLSNSNIKTAVSHSICGMWFEEVINNILNQLKHESVIDDFVTNASKKYSDDTVFEIDSIAMKDHKLYYFSISTDDNEELSRFKLYEIKERARIISDDESAVAAITFIDNKQRLIDNYLNVWQHKPKNVLITSWYDLPVLKDKIRKWIWNRGSDEIE